MSTVWLYSLLSVLLVSLISLVGIVTLPIKEKKLKDILIYLVSFSAGAFLGDVFIHLLPEAVKESGFGVDISLYVLSGLVMSFLIEKGIHWKHSHIPYANRSKHTLSLMTLIGDSVHNFIDGLIMGASYLVGIPVGVATTIAVVFHEIPQEIGNFGVLLHSGFSKEKALFFNFITALTAFLGLLVALTLGIFVKGANSFLIPFAAGNFIYIAGSDLIPELHKEVLFKKSVLQFLFLILGIVVMTLLLLLE